MMSSDRCFIRLLRIPILRCLADKLRDTSACHIGDKAVIYKIPVWPASAPGILNKIFLALPRINPVL